MDSQSVDAQSLVLFHTALSLVGIAAGLVVLYGLLAAQRMRGMTALFLITTIATSATGYLFHRDHILPSHVVGALSLIVLALTCAARYAFNLRGAWRAVYVVGAVASLYLNVFVLIAQAFLKLPPLHALAPTGAEPPFAIAQGIVLVLFLALGVRALRNFRPAI